MKKAKTRISGLLSSLCAMILGLLGFGCDSLEPGGGEICMYGTPTGVFKLKGTVKTEDGKAVKDAVVRVTYPDIPSSTGYLSTDTTGNDGKYDMVNYHSNLDWKVVCIPQDDSLEADSTVVNVKYKLAGKESSVWDIGTAEANVDFVLKKKKSTGETE